MTTASWPAGLPVDWEAGSWKITQPFRGGIRTQMNDRNIRRRQMVTKRITTAEGRLMLLPSQEATFTDFIWVTLGGGVLPFTMLVPSGGALVTRTCTITDNSQPYQVETVGPVAAGNDLGQLFISLSLDIEDL